MGHTVALSFDLNSLFKHREYIKQEDIIAENQNFFNNLPVSLDDDVILLNGSSDRNTAQKDADRSKETVLHKKTPLVKDVLDEIKKYYDDKKISSKVEELFLLENVIKSNSESINNFKLIVGLNFLLRAQMQRAASYGQDVTFYFITNTNLDGERWFKEYLRSDANQIPNNITFKLIQHGEIWNKDSLGFVDEGKELLEVKGTGPIDKDCTIRCLYDEYSRNKPFETLNDNEIIKFILEDKALEISDKVKFLSYIFNQTDDSIYTKLVAMHNPEELVNEIDSGEFPQLHEKFSDQLKMDKSWDNSPENSPLRNASYDKRRTQTITGPLESNSSSSSSSSVAIVKKQEMAKVPFYGSPLGRHRTMTAKDNSK
ncbi:hypothetical protein L3V79_04900 [Thiotrichales bacterium 19S9-12]|nr:hypothetical protein [Thiotrichales bacterium 19S9-11]MCF6811695.1 hypothetical protein [Thiotrichales bacterium 19S9-12]